MKNIIINVIPKRFKSPRIVKKKNNNNMNVNKLINKRISHYYCYNIIAYDNIIQYNIILL